MSHTCTHTHLPQVYLGDFLVNVTKDSSLLGPELGHLEQILFVCFVFETGSLYVALAVLELSMWIRLALYSLVPISGVLGLKVCATILG